jgi:sulfoxide reductase heme-binding subunit YedZ
MRGIRTIAFPFAPGQSPAARPRRLPTEKAVALAIAAAPAVWLAALGLAGGFGVRPVHEAIRTSGDWALRLLWLTLLVSPARRLLSAPRLIRARRILGLGAFGLAALHFGLYAAEEQLDVVEIGREIVLRLYLTIGAVATIVLAALAATSNDRAVARLGSARWNALHGSVLAAAALAAVHFLLCSRTNTFEPMLMLGLLAWLVGYRLVRRRSGDVSPLRLVALAAAAAGLTGAAEIAWHGAATGVDPWLVLAAHLDPTAKVRPAWWVLIAGLAAAFLGAYRHPSAGLAATTRIVPPSIRGEKRRQSQPPTARMICPNAAAGSACGQSES